ncbi:MAG TPA: tetratricopeptide repeat protein [Methylomirabilota bacterium]|jgi:tetratricopeptide (TPR) repeat protein|nr:tetratricopeptide repeat protein [Methylomirabilota bacterium]
MVPSPPRAGGDVAAEDPAASSAIRRYEERLAKDPGSLAFALLADAYRKAGRTRDAIRLCREGLERFPEYATARLILAKAFLDDGDAEAALAEVRAILDRSPTDAQAHRLAGDLERRAGRLDTALAHLRQAVALDPTDRESRVLLEVLEGSGKPPGGSTLERLLADDTFATMSFATVCLEQGLVDEAAQILLRLLRKDPGHVQARRKLEDALRMKTQKRKGP